MIKHGLLKCPKNVHERVIKGDSSLGMRSLSFLKKRCTENSMTVFWLQTAAFHTV